MIPLIVFGAIIVVPVLLALIFRVNAVFLFTSICVGYFLQFALSDDVDFALATVIRGSNSVIAARLILLGIPVLLTLFFLRRTQGKSLIFQFVPLLFSGMLLATLVLPLASPAFAQNIYSSQFGNGIKQSQDLVITAAVTLNLVLAWTIFKSPRHHGKHH